MLESAGILSMGGYLPAKEVPKEKRKHLLQYLRKETPLHPEYIDEIETTGCLPGRILTNEEGWGSQPWFENWVQSLSPKKQADPFQGTVERVFGTNSPKPGRIGAALYGNNVTAG